MVCLGFLLASFQRYPGAHAHAVKRVVGYYDDRPNKPFRAADTGSRLCPQVLLSRLPNSMWADYLVIITKHPDKAAYLF